jgi:hypothetical protein
MFTIGIAMVCLGGGFLFGLHFGKELHYKFLNCVIEYCRNEKTPEAILGRIENLIAK